MWDIGQWYLAHRLHQYPVVVAMGSRYLMSDLGHQGRGPWNLGLHHYLDLLEVEPDNRYSKLHLEQLDIGQ